MLDAFLLEPVKGMDFAYVYSWAKGRTSTIGTERSMRMSTVGNPRKCREIVCAVTGHIHYVENKFNQISEVAGKYQLPTGLHTRNKLHALSSRVLIPHTSSLTPRLQLRLRTTESELQHSLFSKLWICTRAWARALVRSTPRTPDVREAGQAGDEGRLDIPMPCKHCPMLNLMTLVQDSTSSNTSLLSIAKCFLASNSETEHSHIWYLSCQK